MSNFNIEIALIYAGCYDNKLNQRFVEEHCTTNKRIITDNQTAAFIAQVAVESAGLKRVRENTNYSPSRMLEIFREVTTMHQALALHGDEEALFNLVYSDVAGNDSPGDGYKFIGRGYIALTGKLNYVGFSEFLGDPAIIETPIMVEDPHYAYLSAYWFFCRAYYKGRPLLDIAAMGDWDKVSRRVNGGTHALAKRRTLSERALKGLTDVRPVIKTTGKGGYSPVLAELQTYMNRIGLYPYKSDGMWGKGTQRGLDSFQPGVNRVTKELYFAIQDKFKELVA